MIEQMSALFGLTLFLLFVCLFLTFGLFSHFPFHLYVAFSSFVFGVVGGLVVTLSLLYKLFPLLLHIVRTRFFPLSLPLFLSSSLSLVFSHFGIHRRFAIL
jgi:hypothetical protein